MNTLPFLLAAALLLAGCMGKPGDDPAAEMPAAALEPAETADAAPEPAPEPAPETNATPAPDDAERAPPPAPEPEPPAAPEPAAPRIDVAFWNGSITAGGVSPPAGPACCVWRTPDGTAGQEGTFQVPTGLKGILVELAWSDAHADLDLQLLAPDHEETVPPEPNGADTRLEKGHAWAATAGAPGQPDAHARILLVDEEALALAGGWTWRVGAKAAQAVPYTVAVSLYYDAPPTSESSALVTPSDNP